MLKLFNREDLSKICGKSCKKKNVRNPYQRAQELLNLIDEGISKNSENYQNNILKLKWFLSSTQETIELDISVASEVLEEESSMNLSIEEENLDISMGRC